jgi:hypothetical protein
MGNIRNGYYFDSVETPIEKGNTENDGDEKVTLGRVLGK